MPFYVYRCKLCKEEFETFHMMGEEFLKKEGCANECDLLRIPQMTYINVEKQSDSKKSVGEVVKTAIKDARDDLKRQKQEMSRQGGS